MNVIKIDEKTVNIDGVIYERREPRTPRPGQIVKAWDENIEDATIDIYEGPSPRPERPYTCKKFGNWKHAEVLSDPAVIGRTLAEWVPDARWFAPWTKNVWRYYKTEPKNIGGGYYRGLKAGLKCGMHYAIPLPTEGAEPIELWPEDDDE